MLNSFKNSKQYIFFFFICILLAYIIGLTIISVINNRLSELTINIPTPKVNIQWPGSSPQPSPQEPVASQPAMVEGFHVIQPGYHHIDPSKNHLQDDNIRGFCPRTLKEMANCEEATSQIEFEKQCQMNQVCGTKHNHDKYSCTYGKTNYINPDHVDPVNRKIFKYNYYPNMTLQDYINWLWLWENEGQKLCYEHMRNLDKLKKNIPLKYQKGVCPPNLTVGGESCGAPKGNTQSYFQNVVSAMGMDVGNAPKGYNLM